MRLLITLMLKNLKIKVNSNKSFNSKVLIQTQDVFYGIQKFVLYGNL